MKLNTMATAALALLAVLTLGACDKKSTSSASTPTASACTYNPTYGTYTLAGTATPCNPTAANAGVCQPAPNNYYTTAAGTIVTCTPGTALPAGAYNGQYNNYNQLGQYQNQGWGCDAYYYQYGIQYIPMIVGGQLQCVRSDLVNPYVQNTPYAYDYSYAYDYPLQGYYQNNQICLGGSWGSISLGGCF